MLTSKICSKCDSTLSVDNFHKDKSRADGLSYKCKECSKGRKDNRKQRWKNASPDQKQRMRIYQSDFRKTLKGKAMDIASSYKVFDSKKLFKNNIDWRFLSENIIGKPCTYCGFPSTGLDRLDNNQGHTKENCVPACKECNLARMDNFSYEEMLVIGKTIREVKINRILI